MKSHFPIFTHVNENSSVKVALSNLTLDDYHYVFLSLSQYVSQENPDDDYFFTEEKMYWTPRRNTEK